ncbi:hypothetical protein RRSWK_06862 [Rhodopirellula sp. SWK7]|nr:hypothetical protein RRSWK_06862 [Rhodopirellula sp. SWK7]
MADHFVLQQLDRGISPQDTDEVCDDPVWNRKQPFSLKHNRQWRQA